jgi:hypothetical protein
VRGLSFPRLVVGLLFGAIFFTACLMPAQSDTHWQLRVGQELWLTRHVRLTDATTSVLVSFSDDQWAVLTGRTDAMCP